MAFKTFIKVLSLVTALSHVERSFAYIPAKATNDSSSFTQSDDLLHLAYYGGPFSVFTADVSRQLLAEGFGDDGNYTNTTTIVPWTRYSKGVLLHFDETLREQPPAAVPWLAMINCDTNGTSFSDVDDIFTICRDLGAQAAVLYSLTAQGCSINQEYLSDYEKVLDVYATTSLQNARIIESQFGNVNSSAWSYDSAALNASSTLIEALLANNALSVNGNVPINVTSTEDGDESVETSSPSSTDSETSSTSFSPSDAPIVTSADTSDSTSSSTAGLRREMKRQAVTTAPTVSRTSTRPTPTQTKASAIATVAINYLGAVVAARNLTVGGLNASSAPTPSQSSNSNSGPNTGLAMIILYSITGVVTFLFFAVILCGAIRAIRYPERYGPRTGFGYRNSGTSNGGSPQGRAQGLARAVLDTFPIVRFGAGGTDPDEERRMDEESGKAGDGERPKELGKDEDDDVELVHFAPTLGSEDRTRTDSGKREGEKEEIEEINSNKRQPDLRTSMSTNSFHSAVSLPPPIEHVDPSLGTLTVVGPSSATDPASERPTLDSPSHSHPSSTPTPIPNPSPQVSVTDEDQLSCPICVCEFTEGDSIRILPCDARHQFHVECIDPWLLGVSRLCPLCRLDLGENRGEGGGGAARAEQGGNEVENTRSRGSEDSEGDGEARERERERHEEERVARHLRGLLHRGSTSTSTPATVDAIGGRTRTRSIPNALDLGGGGGGPRDTVGLRSRFVQYVAVKRRRRANNSSSSETNVPSPLAVQPSSSSASR
ncbi:RING-H2 finger protein [Sporobolomyces salmoneus]|uniref:RING-H2 finger protein n=1 Tax=Sporobolomyces salmoneus TaxID=183962 RepID=UPI0031735A3B